MQAVPQAATREAVLNRARHSAGGHVGERVGENVGENVGEMLAAVGRHSGIAIPQLAELIGVSTRTIGGVCANCRNRASCDAWAGPRVAIGK